MIPDQVRDRPFPKTGAQPASRAGRLFRIMLYRTGCRATPTGPASAINATLARSAAAMTENIAIAPAPLSSGNNTIGTRAAATRFTAQVAELTVARIRVGKTSAA